ncbi:MAG: hypothetical protein GXO39_07305 [Thermotogae bacterium]|nr:hypothetical protein [Thermotogota bacterium]
MIEGITQLIKEYRKVPSYLAGTISGMVIFLLIYNRTRSVSEAVFWTIIIVFALAVIDHVHFREEAEIERLANDRIKNEIRESTLKLVEKHFSPYLRQFFEVLESEGVMKLRDLEKEIFRNLSLAFIVLERGESLPSNLKYILTNILEGKNPDEYRKTTISTIFRHFMLNEVPKLPEIERVLPIKISQGFHLFLVIPSKHVLDIEKTIVLGYKSHVNHLYQLIQNHPEIENDEKQKFKEWYNGFNPPTENPVILILFPYQTSIKTLLEHLSEGDSEDIKEIISPTIENILKQTLGIREIKLAYLFEAAGYNKRIVDKLINLDKRLKIKLGKGQSITLTEFLGLSHPYNRLLTSVQSIDPQLYNEITTNEGPLTNLERLINDLRLAIYGMPPQGETV